MPIDGRSALGAEVAVSGVKVECTDTVFAARTLELYSPFYPIGSVVRHDLIVVLCSEGRMHRSGLSKARITGSSLTILYFLTASSSEGDW